MGCWLFISSLSLTHSYSKIGLNESFFSCPTPTVSTILIQEVSSGGKSNQLPLTEIGSKAKIAYNLT